MKPLRLYVFPDWDGILVSPEEGNCGRPNSRRRVYVAGTKLDELIPLQLDALIDIAFRDPNVRKRATKAVFYDGRRWAGVERERRHFAVLRHTLGVDGAR